MNVLCRPQQRSLPRGLAVAATVVVLSTFILQATLQAAEKAPTSTSAAPSQTDVPLLDSVERVRRIMRQATVTEVQAAIADAREHGSTDPAAVNLLLTIERERVRQAPELDPADRDHLLDRLAAAQRSVARLSAQHTAAQLHKAEADSERAARGEMNRQLTAAQRMTAQQIARSNQAAARGDYHASAEAAQRAATAGASHSGAAATAMLEAGMKANLVAAQSLRDRHWAGLQQTHLVDEAQHVPIADDPPINYPPADDWLALSERRRKWGESASTYRPSPGEERINKALKEPTEFRFENLPLADAIDYLKHRHDIEIALDQKELSIAGVDPSAAVTRSVKGITLRSGLKLLLEDLDLTYVVQDDVLLITTKEKADRIVTARVYPVADLVIPIPIPGHGYGGFGGWGNRGPRRWRP